MQLSDEAKAALTTEGIPEYMHGAIIRYYENGFGPGHFFSALINNDLQETYARADDTNVNRIKNYIMWFYNYAPGGSWGYPNAVEDWLARKEFQRESVSDIT